MALPGVSTHHAPDPNAADERKTALQACSPSRTVSVNMPMELAVWSHAVFPHLPSAQLPCVKQKDANSRQHLLQECSMPEPWLGWHQTQIPCPPLFLCLFPFFLVSPESHCYTPSPKLCTPPPEMGEPSSPLPLKISKHPPPAAFLPWRCCCWPAVTTGRPE
ncbi:unnamed protein product [Leuciscus chuanchicus]